MNQIGFIIDQAGQRNLVALSQMREHMKGPDLVALVRRKRQPVGQHQEPAHGIGRRDPVAGTPVSPWPRQA